LIDLLVANGGESHAQWDHPTRVDPFPWVERINQKRCQRNELQFATP